MKNIISSFSKMWLKVLNLEQSLFPQLEASFGALSLKEEKLMKILDFAEIETFISAVQITNPPKDREAMARAFVAKSVYSFQTTRFNILYVFERIILKNHLWNIFKVLWIWLKVSLINVDCHFPLLQYKFQSYYYFYVF